MKIDSALQDLKNGALHYFVGTAGLLPAYSKYLLDLLFGGDDCGSFSRSGSDDQLLRSNRFYRYSKSHNRA
jgi:hypothetical protein